MKVVLDIKKNVEQNAGSYFTLARKLRKKLAGAQAALASSQRRLQQMQEEQPKKQAAQSQRKREWYEKFRWFLSSDGFLCVGGRDATSNDIIIKKHAEKGDVIFHTNLAGSPFFIVKNGESAPPATIQEAADATFIYSRAWKLGLSAAEVFSAKPEQLSKTPQSGEYVPKGAFVVRGKTGSHIPRADCAVGILPDKRIMGGPPAAVRKNCTASIVLERGNEKTAAIAKYIRKKLGGELDDLIKVIPAGGVRVKK